MTKKKKLSIAEMCKRFPSPSFEDTLGLLIQCNPIMVKYKGRTGKFMGHLAKRRGYCAVQFDKESSKVSHILLSNLTFL